MESFKLWLEQNDIQYLGHSEYAGTTWVTFAIRGKRYEYAIDPLMLEPYTVDGKKFTAFIRYAPGRALNMVKKKGKLINKPNPNLKPKDQQGQLF